MPCLWFTADSPICVTAPAARKRTDTGRELCRAGLCEVVRCTLVQLVAVLCLDALRQASAAQLGFMSCDSLTEILPTARTLPLEVRLPLQCLWPCWPSRCATCRTSVPFVSPMRRDCQQI